MLMLKFMARRVLFGYAIALNAGMLGYLFCVQKDNSEKIVLVN